jgi:hypothetical protein
MLAWVTTIFSPEAASESLESAIQKNKMRTMMRVVLLSLAMRDLRIVRNNSSKSLRISRTIALTLSTAQPGKQFRFRPQIVPKKTGNLPAGGFLTYLIVLLRIEKINKTSGAE